MPAEYLTASHSLCAHRTACFHSPATCRSRDPRRLRHEFRGHLRLEPLRAVRRQGFHVVLDGGVVEVHEELLGRVKRYAVHPPEQAHEHRDAEIREYQLGVGSGLTAGERRGPAAKVTMTAMKWAIVTRMAKTWPRIGCTCAACSTRSGCRLSALTTGLSSMSLASPGEPDASTSLCAWSLTLPAMSSTSPRGVALFCRSGEIRRASHLSCRTLSR